MQDEITAALRQGIADLDEDGVLATVRANLAAGADPAAIIAACEEGMRLVGEHYEQGEYFLSGLIMAGEIFREVLDCTWPRAGSRLGGRCERPGAAGDRQRRHPRHRQGHSPDRVACPRFCRADLGVDVSPEAFVAKALTWRPDIIGLSGLLTTAYEPMRETVRLLRAQPELAAPPIPIIIGGGTLNEQVRAFAGADYWCNDALEGVRLCQRIMAPRVADAAGPSRGLVV